MFDEMSERVRRRKVERVLVGFEGGIVGLNNRGRY